MRSVRNRTDALYGSLKGRPLALLDVDATDLTLLKFKHGECLRLEAIARSKAASAPDLREKNEWLNLARSWRELAAQIEVIGATVIARTLSPLHAASASPNPPAATPPG
jgi:hypothetical protein